MKKRILSFLMAIAMIFGLIPVNAYAASTPSLAYRWGNYDGQNYFEDTTQPLEQRISLSPSGNTMMFFYYTDENGKETQLDVSQLSIPNTNIATLERNQHNPNAVTIFPKNFGSTEVNYTTGGQTYSVVVDVELPVIGFYSTNQATQSSYISEFKVTETSNTIYLIGTHGWIFDRVDLEPDFEDVANITSIAGNVVEIKVTGTPRNNFWYHLTYDASNTGHSGTMKDQMAGISIKNGKGMFGYRWGDQNGDSLTENLNNSISDRLQLAPGDSHSMFFYFDKDETSTRLNASDLVSSNTNIIRITESNRNPDAVEVWAEGFGTATIQYVNSGKTYSMDVEVVLPEVGFYSTPTASKASYINEFKLTETNDTFYLVSCTDWKFDSIRGGGLNEVTTITNHGSYLEFKVAEGFRSGQWYGIDYTMSNPNENWTRDEGRGITLRNTKPSLSFRYGNHENDMITENPNAPLNNKWETAPGYSSELFIYYVEDEIETRVALKDLTVSNEDVIVLSECKQNGDAVFVEVVGFGNAAISYTVNGKTYSIEVESGLPEFGFYTSKTPSKETYINEFTITEDTDTFYFVSTGDWEFTDAKLREDAAHIGTVKYTPTYVEIQVTGDVDSGRWYQVEYELINVRNQDTRSENRGIRIYEGRPSLSFRFGQYDNNQVIENLDWSLSKKWNAAPGDTTDLFMYYIADGKETRVKVDDLKVSNENVIVLSECDRNSDAVHVEALNFGPATISYTVNGKTHSVEVEVGLPEVGFYTSQAASQATYIKEFKVTETNDTVYMVSTNDWKFDSIRGGGLPEVATITNHGSYLEIKVTEDFQSGRWYGIDYTMSNPNESKVRDEGRGITLRDARPSLSFRFAEYDNDQVVENTNWQLTKKWWASPENSMDIFIYYIEDGKETKLAINDLTVSDDNVIALSECDRNKDAIHVEALDFGPATISYTVNGKTYSIEVEVGLPDIGFYTSKTASKETYINEFKVTEDTDTFYLVSIGEWEFTDARLVNEFADIATIKWTPTYVEIQVTGDIQHSRGYEVYFEAINVNDSATRTNHENIRVIEGRPSLSFRYAEHENDQVTVNPDAPLQKVWNAAPGNSTDLFIYYVEDGNETNLKVGDLNVSDNNVIVLSECDRNGDAVHVEAVGFGPATISYTVNGKTHSIEVEIGLPEFGFYTSKTASKEAYLNEFKVTEDTNTFYFVSTGDWEFTNATLHGDFKEIATINVTPTYLEIQVTGKVDNGRGYGFEYELAHVREPETRTEDAGICIYEGRPILAYCGPSDEPSGHGQFETYLNTAKGYGTDVWVYFVVGDQETKLSLDNLKSSDEDIIQIVPAEWSDGMVCLKTVGWGKAKVIYTDANGKEYSFDVESQLQDFGYYKNPVNTKENWLSGTFTLTDDDNTFYFLSNGGEEIQNLELGEWEQEFLTIELSPDRLWMKVTVKEELPRGNGHFGFGFETINGDDVCGHYYGIEIIDERTPIIEFAFDLMGGKMEIWSKDIDGNLAIDVFEEHAELYVKAESTVKECFDSVDISIKAMEKACSKFVGWTVYEYETAEWFEVPAGEELNIGDPDLTIIYAGQAENDEDGKLYDVYIGFWYCTTYEEVSTDKFMTLDGTKHHYVIANWEEAHDWETDFTVDKPATTTEAGVKSRHCKDCEEVTDITEIPMIELGGWKQDATGWWYENTDGSYTTANWQQIDGEWYYFNKDGYRVTDWQNIRGTWYYFDKATGIMAAETWIGNYYVNAAGVMQTGWLELSEGWYYLGTSGEVQTGWYQVRGTWYYGQTSGAQKGLMYVGLEEIDGVTYYFDSFGAMKTGWQLIGLDDYYFTSSGAMLTNAWQGAYYLGADGKMLTNAWVGKYYVGATGAYQTGWLKLSEGWYYLGTSGAVQTGWFAVGTTWYYGNPDSAKPGLLLEKVWLDDTYYFNADGAMVTGWYEINDAWYYFDASGAKVTSKWIGNYYLKADGTMAVSEWVDNNKYYVGPDGVWIP